MEKAKINIILNQLKEEISSSPEITFKSAQQQYQYAHKITYTDGLIQALLIMSQCCWHLMDYHKGLKLIKTAQQKQSRLQTDEFLPEILHVHALQLWGKKKYYSAQQYWIKSLEQSSLADDVVIQIEALIGLGNVWRQTEDYELAASAHKVAVNVANNVRINWLEGKARLLLAWDYYLLENYLDMLTVLDDASEILESHDNMEWNAQIWGFKGLALLGLKRFDAASHAAKQAYKIANEHNFTWIKIRTYTGQAHIAFLCGDTNLALKLLKTAEKTALKFNHNDVLSAIHQKQYLFAESQENYQLALSSFKKYRQQELIRLKEKDFITQIDKAYLSKNKLEQRARKLLNRIQADYEYNPEKHFSNVVSETYWWEQLVLFKTELKHSQHTVIVIYHKNPEYLDTCTELIRALSTQTDLISRLSGERIAMLVSEKNEAAIKVHQTIQQILTVYPWQRRGLKQDPPIIYLQDILTFPFTLEQLEDFTPVATSLDSNTTRDTNSGKGHL